MADPFTFAVGPTRFQSFDFGEPLEGFRDLCF